MLGFFGAPSALESSRQVSTKEEMEAVLALAAYQSPTHIQLLEVHMDVMDIPWRLKNQIAIVKERSKMKKGEVTREDGMKALNDFSA